VFRHRHEIESGRTSSISQQIMGLDTAGNLVKSSNGLREMEWGEIVAASSKASLPGPSRPTDVASAPLFFLHCKLVDLQRLFLRAEQYSLL
jgi:hypothetical protein